METKLEKYTIEQVTDGFHYSKLEEKGLYGLSGRLTVQPEFQRAYLYLENGRDADVIDSVLKGYPLGLLYFNVVDRDKGRLEVLVYRVINWFSVGISSECPRRFWSRRRGVCGRSSR
ncbi:hypothetical protein [Nocardia farcinica]|uniref:hypothetical protein n=1 Tax=Nocardia farcinica TaxID=37329 RepID=UPI001E3E7C93|nr:hypothetical protein [Nocardia farcinica]